MKIPLSVWGSALRIGLLVPERVFGRHSSASSKTAALNEANKAITSFGEAPLKGQPVANPEKSDVFFTSLGAPWQKMFARCGGHLLRSAPLRPISHSSNTAA